MVAREGIEPPTRGFSARCRVFQGFNNQSLAALATPLPWLTKAQSWHSQFELVTFLAQGSTRSRRTELDRLDTDPRLERGKRGHLRRKRRP